MQIRFILPARTDTAPHSITGTNTKLTRTNKHSHTETNKQTLSQKQTNKYTHTHITHTLTHTNTHTLTPLILPESISQFFATIWQVSTNVTFLTMV